MIDRFFELTSRVPYESRWVIAICILIAIMLSVVLVAGNEPKGKQSEPLFWWVIIIGIPVVFALVLLGARWNS